MCGVYFFCKAFSSETSRAPWGSGQAPTLRPMPSRPELRINCGGDLSCPELVVRQFDELTVLSKAEGQSHHPNESDGPKRGFQLWKTKAFRPDGRASARYLNPLHSFNPQTHPFDPLNPLTDRFNPLTHSISPSNQALRASPFTPSFPTFPLTKNHLGGIIESRP